MPARASAKRYAQAVFQIALDKNTLDLWHNDLETVAEMASDPAFSMVMDSPRVHFNDKARIAREKLSGLHPEALNLALLLITKGRLDLAPEVAEEYEHFLNAHRGIEHAEVITAVPLSKEEHDRVAKGLADMVGKEIILESKVDPEIIGGLVAKVGDLLIEGSVRGRLKALKKSLGG